MKKTFLIGFIGLFLVGGFVTGLYLVNQQTNPFSRASGPVQPPVDKVVLPPSEDITPSLAPTTGPTGSATLQECQKLFSLKEGDVGYLAACDKNGNKKIDAGDYELMSGNVTN